MAREGAVHTEASLSDLCATLDDLDLQIVIDEQLKGLVESFDRRGRDMCFVDVSEISQRCDILVVVGGDGSLLSAARTVAGTEVPVLGINRGRLGFLTDIAPADIDKKVREVLAGDFIEESRFLLSARIVSLPTTASEDCVPAESTYISAETPQSIQALNDIVLHPFEHVSMIEFELFINDEFIYRQRSDGLIISTPTGSTAYALSCGGAIMHPSLDALSVVPINAHTLSSRPITVHGSSVIRLKPCSNNRKVPHITADGQLPVILPTHSEVLIEKSNSFRLIHPRGYNFYETCRNKLGWASYSYD